jgi:hypothetical protein
VYGRDTSAAVDDERGRQRFEAAVLIAGFVVAKHDAVVDFSFFDEGIDGLPAIVIHRDTENFEAAVLVFALEFLEPGDLNDAGSAPGCPEIEQDDFALIVGEVNDLAVGVLEGEIRRWFALVIILDYGTRGFRG